MYVCKNQLPIGNFILVSRVSSIPLALVSVGGEQLENSSGSSILNATNGGIFTNDVTAGAKFRIRQHAYAIFWNATKACNAVLSFALVPHSELEQSRYCICLAGLMAWCLSSNHRTYILIIQAIAPHLGSAERNGGPKSAYRPEGTKCSFALF